MTTTVKFFDKQKALLPIAVLIFTASCVGVYLYLSDTFKPLPYVEIEPKNSFDKTLKVVGDNDYAPYSYVDAKGNYQGYDVELMRELANRLNMNLDLKLIEGSDITERFMAGEADIIMNMDADLIVNNNQLIATLPIAEKQYVVYGKEKIASVADLYGRRVASQHHLPGLGLDDEITYLDSYENIFLSLKRGEYCYRRHCRRHGRTYRKTHKYGQTNRQTDKSY